MSLMWQKILEIARKTGDRVIVMDSTSDEAFVLMELASYERLLEGAPNRLTTEKNTVNIVPMNVEQANSVPDEVPPPDIDSFAELSEEKILEDERFHLEPID